MTLSQMRSRVNTLQRKFALALSVVRARRLAEKLCNEWAAAKSENKPLPDTHDVTIKVREARIGGASMMGFQKYLRECRERDEQPKLESCLHTLLIRATTAGLVRATLRWEARSEHPNTCRPKSYTGPVFPIMALKDLEVTSGPSVATASK